MNSIRNPHEVDHRIDLVTALVRRSVWYDNTASECLKDAVRSMCEQYLCDVKFDRYLLKMCMQNDGWTDDDFDWFGISDMFEEEEE